MKLLFTFYTLGNYIKIKNGRRFAKIGVWRHRIYSQGDLLQGIYKMTGHFFCFQIHGHY